MSKLRTVLLATATALATLPALAPAQTPPSDQNGGWHGRDGRGDRDHGGQPNGGQPPAAAQSGRFGVGRPGGDRGGEPGRYDAGGARPDNRGFGAADGRPGGGRPDTSGGPRGFEGRDQIGNRGFDRDHGPGNGWNRGAAGGWDGGRGSSGAGDRGRGGDFAARGFGRDWRGDRRYDWRGWRDQHRELYRGPRYLAPRGYSYRPFGIGYRLDPFFYDRSYWINDPYQYRLPPAYGPYRWVRYFDDVLLVDLRTGEVVDVINRFFW